MLDDILLRSNQVDDTELAARRRHALRRSHEILAAQIDELKQTIIRAFGVFGRKAIYNLAMFRNPENDVAELVQRLKRKTRSGKRSVLLAVLRESPKRQQEHVDSMKAIGQPANLLEEFKRARARAVQLLSSWQPPTEVASTVTETINVIKN